MSAERPDPTTISDRSELSAAMRAVRIGSGATIRELVDRSGGLHGTISGWFSGHHVPTKASAEMFSSVLAACGIADEQERDLWWDAVTRVRAATVRRSADQSRGTDQRKGSAPYKGLAAFESADADWFFGRADVTMRLRSRVDIARESGGGLVFVLGASGSGKSSILRAGLAPAYEFVEIRSGIGELREFLAGDAPPAPGSILVFDQAEELWTVATPDDRRRFLDVAATWRAETDVVLVLGLRADFYQNAASEDVLLPGLADNPVVVGRLTEQQLREVITLPASKAGMTVDDSLVQVLVGELGPSGSRFAHDSGALPLLSHALLTTWQRSGGRTLTVADYLATGGIGGAVGQSAEEVFDALTEGQQRETRRMFMRLVNLDFMRLVDVDDDVVTRRRVDRVELFRGDADASVVEDVDTVIERFAARRLITVDEETVQVTHEALLTAWQRLRDWLDADRQWVIEHRRLTHAAEQWDESDRDDSALLTPARLAVVQDALGQEARGQGVLGHEHHEDLNFVERAYVRASANRRDTQVRTDRRRRRILEILVASLATLTVLAVTFAISAFVARSDANDRRIDAEHAEAEAISRQISGVAQSLRTQDPGLASYFALAAYEVDRTPEARSVLLDASAIHTPARLAGVEGNAVASVDPNGNFVATAGSDGIVRFWSLVDDGFPRVGEVGMPAADDASVLAFDPRGGVLAVAGASGLALWNVANPVEPELISSTAVEDPLILSYSPDGRTLVVGTATEMLRRFDVSDPSSPRDLGGIVQPGVASAAEFSPDGRSLVTAGAGRAMRVWDTSRWEGPVLDVPTDGSTYTYLQLAFSPDSRSLAAGTTGREVLRWAVDGPGRLSALPPLEGFTSYVNDVAFSDDGARLAAASSDNSSQVWNAATGELQMTLPGPTVVNSIAFGPDALSVVTAGADGITRIWPLPGPVMSGAQDTVFIDPIDASGSKLLAGIGSRGNGLALWDVTDPDRPSMSSTLMFGAGETQTGAAAITADGNLAAGGTASGGFQLWNIDDPANPTALGAAHPAVSSLTASLTFGRSGTLLAVAGQNSSEVALWSVADPSNPQVLGTVTAGAFPAFLSISPDEKVLAVPTIAGVVQLWDITDRSNPRPTATLEGFDSDAQAVTFSPDGAVLAAGSADRSIQLWSMSDPESPRRLARIVGPSSAVYSVNFDRTGTRLAVGVGGQALWVWDVSDPSKPVQNAVLTASGARVYDAVFSPDGRVIFAGGPSRTVRVWRTDPDEVRARLCEGSGSTVTQQEWSQYLPGVPFRTLCSD